MRFSSQADRRLTVAAAAAATAAAVAMAGLSHSNSVLAAAPSVDFEAVENVSIFWFGAWSQPSNNGQLHESTARLCIGVAKMGALLTCDAVVEV